MDIQLPDPQLPDAPAEYSQMSEAEFRAAVLRALQELVIAVRAIAAGDES